MSAAPNPAIAARPRWSNVDLVLLDMDGTLLDLRFDNYFWLELVPERFARKHDLTVAAAKAALAPRFAERQGTLSWYCTDFWSRELGLEIAALKREVREHVRFLPGAREFLVELRRRGLCTVLVTNAHQDSLAIKSAQTGLLGYLDRAISSHQYGAPKEHPEFWNRLHAELGYDPANVLFVDDGLPVLRAAKRHGIGQIFAVSHPDTSQAGRTVEEFAAVRGVAELLCGE
jgi:HAD superfamily hydrolase (TIGR01509 family)